MSVLSFIVISYKVDLSLSFSIPKLHKCPYKQRFIIRTFKCSTKPLDFKPFNLNLITNDINIATLTHAAINIISFRDKSYNKCTCWTSSDMVTDIEFLFDNFGR